MSKEYCSQQQTNAGATKLADNTKEHPEHSSDDHDHEGVDEQNSTDGWKLQYHLFRFIWMWAIQLNYSIVIVF